MLCTRVYIYIYIYIYLTFLLHCHLVSDRSTWSSKCMEEGVSAYSLAREADKASSTHSQFITDSLAITVRLEEKERNKPTSSHDIEVAISLERLEEKRLTRTMKWYLHCFLV